MEFSQYKLFPLRELAADFAISHTSKLPDSDLFAIGDIAYKNASPALRIVREALAMRTASLLRNMPANNAFHTQLNTNPDYATGVMGFLQWSQAKLDHEIVKLEATYSY